MAMACILEVYPGQPGLALRARSVDPTPSDFREGVMHFTDEAALLRQPRPASMQLACAPETPVTVSHQAGVA